MPAKLDGGARFGFSDSFRKPCVLAEERLVLRGFPERRLAFAVSRAGWKPHGQLPAKEIRLILLDQPIDYQRGEGAVLEDLRHQRNEHGGAPDVEIKFSELTEILLSLRQSQAGSETPAWLLPALHWLLPK